MNNVDKKVLLIQPPISNEIYYPLGLATLIKPLIKNNYIVKGFDFQLNSISKLFSLLKQFKPDFIGITSNSNQFRNVLKICKKIKNIYNPIIIIGGPHSSLFPKESLKSKNIDYVVIGSGEKVLPILLKEIKKSKNQYNLKTEGIAYRNINQKIIINKSDIKLDINTIADRDIFPLTRYKHDWRNFGITAPIITSIGCKKNCMFCSTPKLSNKTYRTKNIETIIKEIDELVLEYKTTRIRIEDDQFLQDINHSKKLLKIMILKSYKIIFDITNGIDPENLNEEIILLLSKANFKSISLGIEHPDIKIRNRLGRKFSEKHLKDIIYLLKKNNIVTSGYYIITSKKISEFISILIHSIKTELNMAHLSILQKVPGSSVIKSNYSIISILYQKLFYIFFYARPSIIIEIIKREGFLHFLKGILFFLNTKIIK